MNDKKANTIVNTPKTTIGGTIMKANTNSIVNTTITSKEATAMTTMTNENIRSLAKAINNGIRTPDIEKFFNIKSDEIALVLNAYYTLHKVYGKRLLETLAVNDSTETRKRASYSDTSCEAIVDLIKRGATMEDLTRCFNVKKRSTITKWLTERWPKVGKKYLALLEENEKRSSKERIVETPFLPEEVTYESWYGFNYPSVDCLISKYMNHRDLEVAKDYCEQQGLSYAMSHSGSYITIQAALMGRPTIISDSKELPELCKEDAIPHLSIADLYSKVVFIEKKGDLDFSSDIKFHSFHKSKSGIFFAKSAELIAEQTARLNISDVTTCKILVYAKDNVYKEAPEQFGLKDRQCFMIMIEENGMISTWKYQLSDGHFYEISYGSGLDYMIDYIIEKIS